MAARLTSALGRWPSGTRYSTCSGCRQSGSDCRASVEQTTLPSHERRHAFAGEFVGALVLDVAGVALDPAPVDLVAVAGGVEALPQLDVLDGCLGGGLPAVLLPAVNPFADAVLH